MSLPCASWNCRHKSDTSSSALSLVVQPRLSTRLIFPSNIMLIYRSNVQSYIVIGEYNGNRLAILTSLSPTREALSVILALVFINNSLVFNTIRFHPCDSNRPLKCNNLVRFATLCTISHNIKLKNLSKRVYSSRFVKNFLTFSFNFVIFFIFLR